MKMITRTFITSVINASSVKMEKGEFISTPHEPITISDSITEDKAIAIVRKTYGKNLQYIINSITTTETLRSMSVDDFIKYSNITE